MENNFLFTKTKVENDLGDSNIFDDKQINQVIKICKNKIKVIDLINQ